MPALPYLEGVFSQGGVHRSLPKWVGASAQWYGSEKGLDIGMTQASHQPPGVTSTNSARGKALSNHPAAFPLDCGGYHLGLQKSFVAPGGVRAHSTRGMATTWPLFKWVFLRHFFFGFTI